MTPRELVLATIRRSLGVTGAEATRQLEVATRLAGHPPGIVPERGQLPPAARVDPFVRMVEGAAGAVERVADPAAVPAAVARFLRALNLPLVICHGADPLLASVPWERAGPLEVRRGAS